MRILLDTDPGIDDALAILFLTAQPHVEITSIGSVHGIVTAERAAENALRVLDTAGVTTVPVAVGARRPLVQPLHVAETVHGPDGLAGLAACPTPTPPVPGSAVERLLSAVRRYPGQITVLALGPLTNLALATLIEPDLPRLVRNLVVVGGPRDVTGDHSVHIATSTCRDPEAADLVYGAGFDLTVVGLEVTEFTRADTTWCETLNHHHGPRARFAARLLDHYMRSRRDLFGQHVAALHDCLAAVIALDPGVATYRTLPVHVERCSTHARGRTVIDSGPSGADDDRRRRRPAHVVHTVDESVFLDQLQRALAKED